MSEPLPPSVPQQGIAFTITGKEIWESLEEIKKSVSGIQTELKGVPDQLKDHEIRLRLLEKRLWVASGFALAGGGALGALSRFLGS